VLADHSAAEPQNLPGSLILPVTLWLCGLCLALPFGVTGHAQGRAQVQPPTTLVTPAIPGVVAAGTPVELVNGTFRRTEGPVGMPDGSILFSDANKITRIDGRGGVYTFVEVSNEANAVSFDQKGRLIGAQRAAGNEKVGVLHPPGDTTVLADSYQGKPFNRLNDLVVDSRGGVYFTDTAGIYYVPSGGKVARVAQGIPNPNGVLLSPNERILYANDKDGLFLLAFDVATDGTLSNRRNFARYKSLKVPGHKDPLLAEDNGADGMAVDSAGRLYVTTNLGVEVFGTAGELLGVIPAIWGGESFILRKPQNVAFAGPDKKTLYIVGAGAVFKVQTLAQGIQTRAK
jgi:gluconolactonase